MSNNCPPSVFSFKDDNIGLIDESSIMEPALEVPDNSSNPLDFILKTIQEKLRVNFQGAISFSGVNEQLFVDLKSEGRRVRRLRLRYHSLEHKVRIEMPSPLHESLAAQMSAMLADKLRESDLLNTACVPSLSPSIRFGPSEAQPDGCFGPINSQSITATIKVGVSETQNELDNDARFWVEHPESKVELCITVKLLNPSTIIMSIFRPSGHLNSSRRQLRSLHRSSTMTDRVVITRNDPDHLVQFDDPNQTEIRLPVTAFCGLAPPPGANVNLQSSLTITKQDLQNYGRLHWIGANGY